MTHIELVVIYKSGASSKQHILHKRVLAACIWQHVVRESVHNINDISLHTPDDLIIATQLCFCLHFLNAVLILL